MSHQVQSGSQSVGTVTRLSGKYNFAFFACLAVNDWAALNALHTDQA